MPAMTACASALPTGIDVAILKYWPYDIDRIISRIPARRGRDGMIGTWAR